MVQIVFSAEIKYLTGYHITLTFEAKLDELFSFFTTSFGFQLIFTIITFQWFRLKFRLINYYSCSEID